MGGNSFWNWSLKLFTVAGIEVRIHWSLMLISIFYLGTYINYGVAWWLMPPLLLIPFISILLHEFGHSLTARAVGGDSRKIIMWVFGGLAMCSVPHQALKKFMVAAAGPVVTVILAAGSLLLINDGFFPSYQAATDKFGHAGGVLLHFTATINVYLLIFNLIPAYPLDGGAMLRALLWPVIGLRRAQWATIYIAYLCLIGIFIFAVLQSNIMLALLAAMLAATVVQEHAALKQGYDAYSAAAAMPGPEAWQGTQTSKPSALDNWRQKRQHKQMAKIAKQTREREEELDRLLAKVSESGLPSLTASERKFLQKYSQDERKEL